MSHRNSKSNSSPVTRPLNNARVTSKALSRSAKIKSSSDKQGTIFVPNPAKPARASKNSAHIVSFADAKRAGESAKVGSEAPSRSTSSKSAALRMGVSSKAIREDYEAANPSRHGMGKQGAHASVDLTKQKKAEKKAAKASKKKFKMPEFPFGKKNGKEFVIPSGQDLTTASSNVYANMLPRDSRSDGPSHSVQVSTSVSSLNSLASRSRGIQSQEISVAQSRAISQSRSVMKDDAPSEKVQTEEEGKGRVSKFFESRKNKAENNKRKKAKEKANKKFDNIYGASDKSAGQGQPGPRAALYSTKMGTKHKKSAKMQIKDARDVASQSMGAIGDRLSNFEVPTFSKAMMRAITAVAVCAIFGFGLYGPAQQYYVQMRETDRLEAEFTEVALRTNNLADSIDSLHTKEGIEDKAHSDLGYVKSGEKSATVKGIAQINLLDLPTSNVAPGSIPAPDTWYSGVLDVLFGYTQ